MLFQEIRVCYTTYIRSLNRDHGMVFREKGSTPIKHILGTVIINSHLMHTSRFDMICSVDTNIYYSERRTLSHGISGVPNCVHV